MSEIRLNDGTINYNGEWLTADDLTKQIKEKMDSGDMKFADLAAILEELNKAIEDSHKLEIKIAISKEDYEKLKSLGGEDDRECVRKAIMAYTRKEIEGAPAPMVDAEKMAIKCPKCKLTIEVSSEERPSIIECPECGTSGRFKPKTRWEKQ
jgi:hypothetical protein